MPFKNFKNANYNALKKLSIRERLQAGSDSNMGQMLISMLTPTQAAELFPKYYQQRFPNISGFLKALPTSVSAARQRAYEEQIENTASGDAAGSNFASGGYRKKWQQEIDRERQRSQISRKEQTPAPQLSPEQRESFDALKSGDIDINDPRMKWLKNTSPDVLQSVGISVVKDKAGLDKYHYTAPQVSDEEVKRDLSSTGNLKQMIDNAAAKYKIDPRIMYGIVRGESGHGNRYDQNINSREESWGPFQMNRASWNPGLGSDFERETGLSVKDPATLNRQADWIASKIAARGNNARRWVASQWYGYGSDVGGPKDFDVRAAGGDRDWNKSWGTMGAGPKSDLVTQNYSTQQINARREQLSSQREAERIGTLAKITQPEGPQNADGSAQPANQPRGTDRWSSITPMGSKNWCGRGVVDLAKKVFRGVDYFDKSPVKGALGGDASSVAYGNQFFQKSGMYQQGQRVSVDQLTPEFIASLPPGTIVAAGGGRADGAGHIQMKIGDRWMSDHVQSRFYMPTQNRPYKDYTILRLTPQGQSYLADRGFFDKSTIQQELAPKQTTVSPNPLPSKEKETPVNPDPTTQEVKREVQTLASVTQPQGPVNAAGPISEQGKQQEPSQVKMETKKSTAVVEPTPSGARYKVNMSGFREMIKKDPANTYPGFMIDMASDQQIVEGFNNDPRIKAAGVRIDEKGVLHVKNTNNPNVKEFLAGKDLSSAITKIEEKKKEEPKVEAKKTPEVKEEPKVEPTKQPEVKKEEPKQAPTKVKAMAEGGTVDINTEKITAYPIGGLQGDNAVVVNTQQRPLFTMNTNENIVMDGKNNKLHVIPNKKSTNIGPTPKDNPMSGIMEEFHSTIQEIKNDFATLKATKVEQPKLQSNSPSVNEEGWLDKINHTSADPFKSPTMRRVATRAAGMETGDATNGYHYSRGNHS